MRLFKRQPKPAHHELLPFRLMPRNRVADQDVLAAIHGRRPDLLANVLGVQGESRRQAVREARTEIKRIGDLLRTRQIGEHDLAWAMNHRRALTLAKLRVALEEKKSGPRGI